MDWESWATFVATALSKFDTLRRIYIGHINCKIYNTPIESIEELKTRIRTEINEISPEPLEKFWDSLHPSYIKQQNGGHFKNLLL